MFLIKNSDGSEGELIGCGGYPWLTNDPAGRVGNTGVVIDEKYAKRGLGSEVSSTHYLSSVMSSLRGWLSSLHSGRLLSYYHIRKIQY